MKPDQGLAELLHGNSCWTLIEQLKEFAVFYIDTKFQIVSWNAGAERVFGHTKAEATGQNISILFTPEDVVQGLHMRELETAKTDGCFAGETWHVRKDGSRFFAADTVTAIKNSEGTLRGYAKVTRDHSARKAASDELLQTNRRVADILESITDAFFVVDKAMRFTYLNRHAEPLLQRTREETIGKCIWEEFPENMDSIFSVGSVFYLQFQKAVKEQVKVKFEQSHPAQETWFEIYMYPSGDGLSVYFHDIGARKAAERELRNSELRYRRLFEAAHDGILILNAESGRISDVNPFLCDLLNYPKPEFIGKELWEIGLFKDQDESRRAFLELQSAGYIRYEDIPLETKGGKKKEVEFISNVYRENGRKVIQCNIRDNTARKLADQEREAQFSRTRAAQVAAERANQLKDEFLATLSHELRTPLTSILGWAEMLGASQLDERAALDAVEVIRRNARMQVQMVDDLLDVSRIITGKLRLVIHNVDLARVIIAAVEGLRPAAEAKSIQLQLRLDSPLGQVSGDADRLQQIAWNLLSNAIKFTPKNGTVVIKLEKVESSLALTIADTGQGISAEFLPHVFDRFRQADPSITRSQGGLGLGLAIVRQLVELHGGTVQVQSEGEGKGSTFTARFPLAALNEGVSNSLEGITADPSFLSDVVRPSLSGVRVLVVDDHEDTRKVLQAGLQSFGAEVEVASSAAEALETIERWVPDVLLSDLGMPNEDGYTLIDKIRRLAPENGGHTPAAALTAYARTEDRMRVLKAGYQSHIPKPVELNELAMVVATLSRTVYKYRSP